jgi:hypothetical protein
MKHLSQILLVLTLILVGCGVGTIENIIMNEDSGIPKRLPDIAMSTQEEETWFFDGINKEKLIIDSCWFKIGSTEEDDKMKMSTFQNIYSKVGETLILAKVKLSYFKNDSVGYRESIFSGTIVERGFESHFGHNFEYVISISLYMKSRTIRKIYYSQLNDSSALMMHNYIFAKEYNKEDFTDLNDVFTIIK